MTCYRCGEEMKAAIIAQRGEYAGKAYTVKTEGMVCPSCGYETLHASQIDGFLSKLADAYRRDAKLLTGAQIREHRNRLGMSQEQFASYLNVGVASVKRWELGKAQDPSSDELIRLKCTLQRAEQNAADVLFRQGGEANEYSGGRSFSFEKLAGVVLFFLHRARDARKALGPLHINKLCWYADAENYKRHGVTITGARYARLPYGPVLDDYQLIFRELQNRQVIVAQGTSRLEPNRDVAPEVFQGPELVSLKRVWERFRSRLHAIVGASHEERAWKETAHAELISFRLVKYQHGGNAGELQRAGTKGG